MENTKYFTNLKVVKYVLDRIISFQNIIAFLWSTKFLFPIFFNTTIFHLIIVQHSFINMSTFTGGVTKILINYSKGLLKHGVFWVLLSIWHPWGNRVVTCHFENLTKEVFFIHTYLCIAYVKLVRGVIKYILYTLMRIYKALGKEPVLDIPIDPSHKLVFFFTQLPRYALAFFFQNNIPLNLKKK